MFIQTIVTNLRPERTAHYVILVLLGVTFGFLDFPKVKLDITIGFHLVITVIAVIAAYQASCVINDFFDQPCDQISNPERPLISASLSPEQYRNYGVFTFVASLLLASYGGYTIFCLILGCHALSWLYSVPPFRLKRFFPVNVLVIAVASWFLFLGGYSIIAGGRTIELFPISLTLWTLVLLPLVISIKDLRDEEGDRRDGVTTLVTLIGKQQAARVLSVPLFFLFCVTPFLFRIKSFLPLALVAGCICSLLLWRSPTHDRVVLVVYVFLMSLVLAIHLFLGVTDPEFSFTVGWLDQRHEY